MQLAGAAEELGGLRRGSSFYPTNLKHLRALFVRRLHDLAGEAADELLRAIQAQLDQDPDRGAMVPGLGGVRKVRVAGRGKGKRGGYRCLYLHLEKRQHIHLLILLAKNEQEDATTEQKSQIRQWVAEIKKATGD